MEQRRRSSWMVHSSMLTNPQMSHKEPNKASQASIITLCTQERLSIACAEKRGSAISTLATTIFRTG
ncbi:unnamed protein product, partial [Brassica rapa]